MRDDELAYGLHAVRHLLASAPESVVELWVQTDGEHQGELAQAARIAGVTMQSVPRRTLDQMSAGASHQGVVARVRRQRRFDEHDLAELVEVAAGAPLFLVLDGVQDPHNLGACLRVANAAGASAVIVPEHRAAGLTGTVRKVASGAAEATPLVVVANLARAIASLKKLGVWVYGADSAAGESLYQRDLAGPVALVLGAEGEGLRRLTSERCDGLLRIPMLGTVESLNVATAAAVCLFEVVRQRMPPKPC